MACFSIMFSSKFPLIIEGHKRNSTKKANRSGKFILSFPKLNIERALEQL